jgi:ABC-type multidrug transport system fused ATPase/permease subunit
MWNRSARRAIPHIHRRLYQTERITIRNATGWEMLRRVLPFVWPKGGAEGRAAKARIVLAFGLLLGGKVLNVQVPYIFRDLIDGLNATIGGTGVEALNVFSVSGTVLLACTLIALICLISI